MCGSRGGCAQLTFRDLFTKLVMTSHIGLCRKLSNTFFLYEPPLKVYLKYYIVSDSTKSVYLAFEPLQILCYFAIMAEKGTPTRSRGQQEKRARSRTTPTGLTPTQQAKRPLNSCSTRRLLIRLASITL